LSLAAICLIVFWPTHRYGFTLLDDPLYVTENNNVRGFNIDNVKWAFTTLHAGFYIPLTWLSFMLDYHIYWLNPSGYHMTNLLFHIANTILLFIALRKMTGTPWKSALTACLFAVHPLHVESVVWITERKDVLSAFFGMIALLAYHFYTKKPTILRYIPPLVFFVLGLLAKPMLVTLPFVLLLLDYWPLKRSHTRLNKIPTPSDNRSTGSSGMPAWLFFEKAPFFVFSAASGLITVFAHRQWEALMPTNALSLWTRLSNASFSYALYILKTLLPYKLAIFYPHPGNTLPIWKVGAAVLTIFLCTVLVMKWKERHPFLLVGWLWYLLTLFPVIGLLQAGQQAMADRFTYIPLIGLFLMMAWGAQNLMVNNRFQKPLTAVLSTLFIIVLCFLSHNQVGKWQDNVSLFQHTVEVTDNNFIAHNHLGKALGIQKKYQAALHHLDEALYINPRYPDAYNNRGVVFANTGRFEKAIEDYKAALSLQSNFFIARMNLGIALYRLGRYPDAVTQFHAALEKDPMNQDARFYSGLAYAGLGDRAASMQAYERLRIRRPDLARILLGEIKRIQ
jgi:tetratricopeptide (TPR) repeat protein